MLPGNLPPDLLDLIQHQAADAESFGLRRFESARIADLGQESNLRQGSAVPPAGPAKHRKQLLTWENALRCY